MNGGQIAKFYVLRARRWSPGYNVVFMISRRCHADRQLV